MNRREFLRGSALTMTALGLSACGYQAGTHEHGDTVATPQATQAGGQAPESTVTQWHGDTVAQQPIPTVTPTKEITPTPEKLRPSGILGVHIPYDELINKERIEKFISNFDNWGVNSLVVDIKDELGRISIKGKSDRFDNLIWLVDQAKQRGIYLVGRQVVMTDNVLARVNPDLVFRYGGEISVSKSGYFRLDLRKSEEIGNYNAVVAEAAVELGFDEIQLDYIRFPFAVFDIPHDERVAAVNEIVARIYEKTKPTGAFLTADVLANSAVLQVGDTMDGGYGQEIGLMGQFLDGICPMAYPNLNSDPAVTMDPYDYVSRVTNGAIEKLKAVNPKAFVNPWIQAYPPMGGADVVAQTRAAIEVGALGAFAWNQSLLYPNEMFLTK